MSFASIAIKTSIPSTAPAATSGALTFITIEDENWLQITGDASSGSGSLYVLRWNADLAEWRPYMEDKPIAVNSAALNGLFSAYYPFPKGEESFVLYDPASAITATASAARTGSPLAAPSTTSNSGSSGGGATEAKQDAGNASLVSILGQLDNKTSTLATASAQTTSNNSLSSIDGKVATAAKQDAGNTSLATIATQQTDGTQKTQVTSSALPTGAATAAKQPALGTAGTPSADVLSVQGVPGGTPQPISASSLPLPTGAATSALQGGGLPAALVGGRLDSNVGAWLGSTAPTVGQKTAANSLPVVLASDTGTLTVASSVTPGSSVSETQQNCSSAAIILAAVASPKVRKIYNRVGNGRLFLRYGSAPTAETDCNFALNPGDTWEMPSIAPGVLEYAGNIYGLIPSGSASVNGLQVT